MRCALGITYYALQFFPLFSITVFLMFLYYYCYFLFCSCLEKSLKNLRTECHWLTSMSWDLCARCDLCRGKVDAHGLCHWHKKPECSHADCAHYIPLETSPLCCNAVNGDCCLLPQDSFQPWIQVNEVEVFVWVPWYNRNSLLHVLCILVSSCEKQCTTL